jgi:Ca2+-dependent lipid-binding protein
MNSQIRVVKHKNFSIETNNKVLKTQGAPKTLNPAWADCFKIHMQNAT